MTPVQPPFQITEQDIARSLDQDDLGRWALLITGCFHLFDSKHTARQIQNSLNQPQAKPRDETTQTDETANLFASA